MPAPKDLIHESSTTTGTGNFTLTAVSGKVRFSDSTYGFGTGSTTDVFDYYISNRDAAEWERGTGHMSDANTLVRDTVIESSNSNNAVSFSAGTKDVTNDVPARYQTEWGMQPIGVPIPVWTHITGVETPPNDPDAGPVYILLTAGEDGGGEHNEGLLDGESVSGSAPAVLATANINLAASPLDNQQVRLINTERRFLRPGSSGTAEADGAPNITGQVNQPNNWASFSAGGSGALSAVSNGANAGKPTGAGSVVGRVEFDASNSNAIYGAANHVRPKNVGATYYMRIL